jgi:hypothetical protein
MNGGLTCNFVHDDVLLNINYCCGSKSPPVYPVLSQLNPVVTNL